MTRKTATGHIRRQTSGRLQGNQDEGCEECRGVALAIYFVLGGKPYYPGAVFTFLFAAGSVPLERWLAARPPLAGKISPAARMSTVMIASGLLALPVALPVLPAAALHSVPLQKINYDLAEAGRARRPRVSRAARPAAQPHRDHHGELRRGRRGRSLRCRLRPAPGLVRAEQFLALGTAACRRHSGDRHRHGSRVPAPGICQRPPGRYL